MMQELRVEKLECRLPLTAGLLDSAAYVDQEVPHFQMNVLEGSRVERQIAFDIPWEYVHRDSQVLLDFSVQGSTGVVEVSEVRNVVAWQAVHEEIVVGPAPLVTRHASGRDTSGNWLSFEEQVPVATVSNIPTDYFRNLAQTQGIADQSTTVSPDYLITTNRNDQSISGQSFFPRGLGMPLVDLIELNPKPRYFNAQPALQANVRITYGDLPSTATTSEPVPLASIFADKAPTGSEGESFRSRHESNSIAANYIPRDTRDFPVDPEPLNQIASFNFVTRFTATLTFDVTGNVGDLSEITLTVNPNDSISFAEQIELGSLNVVDSFVIESEGNEAVTRTIDGGVSVAGRPLMMGGKRMPEQFNGWSIIGAEAVDGENVVFARRGNGTMHRLVADANWALHGFSSIRNMHNAVLRREARLAGSSSLPQLFAGPPDSVHLWSSVASQMLADGIITADVADCITHSHTLNQQTAPAADTYISADELQAAAPTRMYAFEFPVSSPTQTFTFTNGGGVGVTGSGQGGGGSSQIYVSLETTTDSPQPDYLVVLTLYEWDLTAAGAAEDKLASLLELITEHAVTLADSSNNQHFGAVGDHLDCDYVVFHNTLAPIASIYGRAIGNTAGSAGNAIGNTAGSAGNATGGTAGSGGDGQQLNTVTTSYWPSTSGEQNLALAYTKSETLLRIFQWRPLFFS
jgi:hypothetical protein